MFQYKKVMLGAISISESLFILLPEIWQAHNELNVLQLKEVFGAN